MTEKHENLITAYFADQITDSERAELLSLLDTDAEFASYFHKMEEAYISAFIPVFENTKDKNFNIIQKRIGTGRVSISFWKSVAVAASILAMAFLGTALYTGHRFHDAECFFCESDVMTVVAKNGTGTETILPDGTKVCLNASSSLSFNRHFGRSTRDVTLEGEGYFEVVPDSHKLFRVHAGNACVTVKGTIFNVQSYSDESEISVSLIEGSVVLNTMSEEAALTPGHCAVVSRNSNSIHIERADPFASEWRNGKYVFSDKSIPEILQRVERNYGVRFVYADDLFGKERFTGNFSLSLSIDEILSYIDVDRKYRWTRNDDIIAIQKR